MPVHALNWDVPLIGHFDLGLGFAAYNGLTAVIVNIVVATRPVARLRTERAGRNLGRRLRGQRRGVKASIRRGGAASDRLRRSRIMKLSKEYSATCHHRYWSARKAM